MCVCVCARVYTNTRKKYRLTTQKTFLRLFLIYEK